MHVHISVLLILLLFHNPIKCVDENVIRLTDQNFKKQLVLNPNLLVMFFIPWSGMCQKFRPHFARAAMRLKNLNLPVALGKIDCSGAGRFTCESNNLGYRLPQIRFYRNSTFVADYAGSRNTISIIKFMRSKVVPSPVEIKNVEDFKEFIKVYRDIVAVGFFEEPSRLKRMFMRIADELKETIIFGITNNEKIMIKEGVRDGIVMYRPAHLQNIYEEDRVLFRGTTIIGELKNFITRSYNGLVGYRTPANRYTFPNPQIVLYFTVDYQIKSKETKYWRSRIIKIAHKYQKYVTMSISTKDDFEEELVDYSVDYTNPMKPFVLGRDIENQNYVMNEEFSSENFSKFVDDFVNKQIEPFQTSNEIPLEYDGAMKVAVTSNFKEKVIDNPNDILINLYASWSVKNKKLTPILRDLADLLQEEDVDVVVMEVTENVIPLIFKNATIPNVFWLSKTKKHNPVLYEGEKNVDDFIKFIAEHSATEMKKFTRQGIPRQEKDEL